MGSETVTAVGTTPGAAGEPDTGPPRPSLQGPVVATQCPVRAELDHTSAVADRRAGPSDVERARAQAGRAFRAEVLAEVAERADGVVVVEGADDRSAVEATMAALAGDARVVVTPVLPADLAGRRAGGPDLLVRTEVPGPDGEPTPAWVPVVVRRHLVTRDHENGTMMRRSGLDLLDPSGAEVVEGLRFRGGPLGDDALHLAHHWRMLEAAGVVVAEQPALGGVVDRTRTLWWVDLEELRWQPRWARGPVSTLSRYDKAFALRLEVIDHQQRRELDPMLPRRVVPVSVSECRRCPWRDVCHEELEAADHVSLLPATTFDHVLHHGERGVRTRRQVAALDWSTAQVLHGSAPSKATVDPGPILRAAALRVPETPVAEVVGHQTVAVERLHRAGVRTVGDLDRLDRLTLSYGGAVVGHLPTMIDQARAVLAGRPLRTRGTAATGVLRADVEVDVDMENVEEGVYLWGTLTTTRSPAARTLGVCDGYRPFGSWDPMDPAVAAAAFVRFWRWFTDLRTTCEEAGLTFAAYCYTTIEHVKMRQIASASPEVAGMPTLDAVDELGRSPQWIDLHAAVRSQVVTGHGLGLKKVAPLAGFSWRDDDPGGEQSMLWHQVAVTDPDPVVRQTYRDRLLAYNEDDVRATLAVRDWLDRVDLPAVEDWAG